MTEDLAAQAERISHRRARALPILAMLYFTQQFSFFAQQHEATVRTVDHVRIGAWVVLSLVLLSALVTKGFWFHRQALRDLVDDEGTRANRRAGTETGFLAAMLAGIACYFIAMVEPLTAPEAVHAVVSIGIGAALIRFGILERRAHRDE